MGEEVWEVVGGEDRGGIIARTGFDLSSPQLPRRLATGALVACEELTGERMRFRKIGGQGPETGWVSIRIKDRELLLPTNSLRVPANGGQAAVAPLVVPAGQPDVGPTLAASPPAAALPAAAPAPAPAAPPKAQAAPQRVPAPLAPLPGPVGKRIWFVRHGEAEHNVLIDQGLPSSHLRDPGLSLHGMEQARSLAGDPMLRSGALGPVGSEARVQRVVSSPCKRALQTAVELSREASLPVLGLPMLQECTDNPCDTGRPREQLEPEFPGVDLSALGPRWFEKMGSNRGDLGREELRRRCERIKHWLISCPEQRLVVVAHRTLFAYLLQLDFAPAEVIEMRLLPPGAATANGGDQGRAATNGRPASGADGWYWEEARASAELFDLYNYKDERLCSQGSPPLRGTLNTCRLNRGEEAWRNTLKRAGRAGPLLMTGVPGFF